ncbi:MAG: hypothetical protein RsTaC01_0692 [Candidatus Paraimprobicoccus trichonymphae]|uniref:Uncharacterized protein n=1 Tax=Candidatus Paraimprobicoccus trichonymphae TaxID=3033793 RepID=A0AA48I2Z1_9FIRM|nr:MAG: hypothetical protein RsTaC01_0692 [Candidatus Paraimprobicoccus trichonymphae]
MTCDLGSLDTYADFNITTDRLKNFTEIEFTEKILKEFEDLFSDIRLKWWLDNLVRLRGKIEKIQDTEKKKHCIRNFTPLNIFMNKNNIENTELTIECHNKNF